MAVENPGTGGLVSLEVEAGELTAPMVVSADGTASGGAYVETPVAGEGAVAFLLGTTKSESCVVWCG